MPWNRQEEWSAAQLGVNGAALSGTSNTARFCVKTALQVTVEVDIVNTTGAALPVVIQPQTQRGEEATTVWRDMMIGVDTVPAAGVVTTDLYTHPWRYTTPALAGTYRKTFTMPTADQCMRLSGITAAGAGAGDTITLNVRVSY